MNRIISIILLVTFLAVLVSCSDPEVKEISCEDIIKAYEDAGYYVSHGEHNNEADSTRVCYIKANVSDDPDSDYIYFTTCLTEEQAEEMEKTDKYNIVVWAYSAIMGESRWLKSETYGKIEYSYYNSELIKPFEELIK